LNPGSRREVSLTQVGRPKERLRRGLHDGRRVDAWMLADLPALPVLLCPPDAPGSEERLSKGRAEQREGW